ncbi:MAG: hypothetical protein ABJA82_06900 [Myxococcales bacterium]
MLSVARTIVTANGSVRAEGAVLTATASAVSAAGRALSFLLPRTQTSLAKTFRADPLLLWTTAALVVAAWVPLFLTPILPFSDLGINTAAADLIWDTAIGRLPAATYYKVQWGPLPYWTTYGLCSVLGRLFGPLVAAKLLTAFILALVPLSMMRLLLALGRDARLGLWAFALSWEHNLYAGWLALLFGVGLVCFVLAWMFEAETVLDGFRIAPYAALIGLTHVQATWLFAMAGGAITFTTGPIRRRMAIHGAAFLGTILVMVPWLFGQTRPGGGSAPGGMPHFGFEWHTPAIKLSQFFAYTLDNFSRADGERAAALTFVVLVVGPLLLTLVPRRPAVDRDRWSAVVLLAVAGALYALLPWAISGPISHWYTYPRYSTVFLLWMLLIPAPRLRGWATAALLPGILAALLMDAKAVDQFASFGARARPYLDVMAQVPARASVLAIVLDDNDADPDLKLPPYHQFYAYITAQGHGYSPYLWSNNSIPLVYRPGAQLPAPGWNGGFSLEDYGKYYDYVLVQGIQHGDPVAASNASAPAGGSPQPRLLIERTRWRLYAIR